MRKFEKKIRKLLFKLLSFKQYLTLVSMSYFLLYKSGILKNNPSFKYHYFLKNIIKKNDIIIDIGANLGYFSIPFSKWVGQKGFVYAVEPIHQMREVLQKNIGKRKNIKVVPYALGSENKNIKMGNDTRKNSGVIATGSHFVLEENARAEDEFSAEMKKGSELFGNIEKLDFIKCDVEGYETVIIPEMKNIIINHKPIMQIETSGEKKIFLLDFLLGIGFNGYVLKDNRLYSATEENIEGDLLFIHKSKIDIYNSFISTKTDINLQ